jgi:hypothetical protein
VYLLGGPATNDFKQWLNCRSKCAASTPAAWTADRLESGLLFVPGPDEIKILEPAAPALADSGGVDWQFAQPRIGFVDQPMGAYQRAGRLLSPGESITVKDPTGVIRARVIQLTEMRGDERVDVWGFLEAGPDETFLNNSYFEVARPPQEFGAASPPAPLSRVARLPSVLTQVSDILQLRPEEAAQQLAVRLRGVITYADPEWRNGFLQDRGDAIYVDLDPAQKNVQSGQWVELTGRTSPGGFAPEVLSSKLKSWA